MPKRTTSTFLTYQEDTMSKSYRRNVNRRDFVKLSSGVLAASWMTGLTGCKEDEAPPPVDIPVGVQLYCFRRELAEDFPGTVAAVAGLGYTGVEFASAPSYMGHSAQELRTMLDDNGLTACGTHIVIDTLLGDELEKSVEFNQILGNEYLIVRSMREELHDTREHLLETAEVYNQIAENLKPFNMRVGFHNHADFFQKFDDEYLWNIFADATTDDVILQMDTGNAAMTEGVDVLEILKRNPGRHATCHIKPYSATNRAAYFDSDDLNWPEIVEVLKTTAGLEWYIIEYEIPGIPPLEALKDNLDLWKALIA